MAAASQSVGVASEAYGVYANTLSGSQAKAPFATIPTGGGLGDAEAASTGVTGVAQAENLLSMASGAGDSHDASAEAATVAERINILSGLITADGLTALASSAFHGTTADANASGSELVGLVVNGVAIAGTPAPNTQISLPGVGQVILNEQLPSGDGVNSTGITVNMIHVLLQTVAPGSCTLLGCTPSVTTTTGEIIVGSATSSVVR
ncbi:MAG TPA: choice-of-anchor P family protein [Gemmatimonadales bacterium]|nr:choice-of-anchor P family protein [Gemmatimonadales bacterium]